jgi:hypothetical protein
MALSYAIQKQLLAASLPEATEVRLELQDYLASVEGCVSGRTALDEFG